MSTKALAGRNVLPPTPANIDKAAVLARDIFGKEGRPTELLYVFAHQCEVGRRGNVRVVVDLHRTKADGLNQGRTFLGELRRVLGGSARDYRDRIVGVLYGKRTTEPANKPDGGWG